LSKRYLEAFSPPTATSRDETMIVIADRPPRAPYTPRYRSLTLGSDDFGSSDLNLNKI
jgi:hypothetical protein